MATNLSISGKLTVGGGVNLTSLTASTVLVTDSSKNIVSSSITNTELGYLDGVTSNIQTQLDNKSTVGKDTEGMVWTKNENTYNGRSDAEIFNDYTNNIASGDNSHAEGNKTTASGNYGSHAEGHGTLASGNRSHAEGRYTKASEDASHAEGESTTASGQASHAEGGNTTASGYWSHAEGSATTASGYTSHSEGEFTTASGGYSHAEGSFTLASGDYSHAEGDHTKATGETSHAEGWNTTASGKCQHVQGQYNVEDTAGKYAHIVGWGTGSSARKNIHTIDTSGNAVFSGTCTATSHPTSSSRRFKENIRDIDITTIDNLFKIEPKMFDLKEEYGGDKDQVGFIAEDIEPLFPSCVFKDDEGNVASIDYSKFIPYIIKLLQEWAPIIESVKNNETK